MVRTHHLTQADTRMPRQIPKPHGYRKFVTTRIMGSKAKASGKGTFNQYPWEGIEDKGQWAAAKSTKFLRRRSV
jgi:hypothetical protein